MPFEFTDVEDARGRSGLRMIVVPGVPSPWGEAAKGILHVKGLPFVAVRLDNRNEEMTRWAAGERGGPVLFHDDEPPRSGWAEILHLCERLAPSPSLLPADPEERALSLGLSYEICGELGLGWCRRNASVHAALNGGAGFPLPIAQYLASRYGYREEAGPGYAARAAATLGLLAARLRAQQDEGSKLYFGDSLSATDIHSATFMALLAPLPPEHCPMPEALRAAFEANDPETTRALDPILLAHRDHVYETYLDLPLAL